MRLAIVAAAACATSACSVSYPLYDKSDQIKTGSIAQPSDVTPQGKADAVASTPLAPPPGAVPPAPGEKIATVAYVAPKVPADTPAITPTDWTYARGALGLAMEASSAHASVPWANPDSGAYGSFAATAAPALERGATCRDFAASYSSSGREQRLEGSACRTAAGHWEAVAIKTTMARAL